MNERYGAPNRKTNGRQPVPDIPLSVHAKTLPQELRIAGDRTIHIGKGHFGTRGTPGEDPKAPGLDLRVGGRFSAAPGSYNGTGNFAAGRDLPSTPWRAGDMERSFGQDIYLTEALTRELAAEVRHAVTEQCPCFRHFAPHAPDARSVQGYHDDGPGCNGRAGGSARRVSPRDRGATGMPAPVAPGVPVQYLDASCSRNWAAPASKYPVGQETRWQSPRDPPSGA